MVTLPTPGGDADTWGGILNDAIEEIEDLALARVPLSTVTTKGDLVAATGPAAVARVPVGLDGQALVADSTQATGVRWGTVTTISGALAISTASTNAALSVANTDAAGEGVDVEVNSATQPAFRSRIPADSTHRLSITAAGVATWGPGNAAGDTNLYRNAANELKTDDAFTAAGKISGPSVRLINTTSGTRPTVETGLSIYETDTGIAYQGVSHLGSGTAVWAPLPGTVILHVQQTATQSIPGDGTSTVITLTSTRVDRLAGWDAGLSRYTFPLRGRFLLCGAVSYASNATGYRSGLYLLDGSVWASGGCHYAAVTGAVTVAPARTAHIDISATPGTSYIELAGRQNTGSALLTSVSGAENRSTFTIVYLGAY